MELISLQELKGESKMSRLRHKPDPSRERLRKPEWIRIDARSNANVKKVKKQLRDLNLHTVCEEASCPNLAECFSHKTATLMIMGAICTRRCPFCDVAHGRPMQLDPEEPKKVASTISQLGLKYVVITSVDRDDLKDGGAGHFAECVKEARLLDQELKVEILVPDFRGRIDVALEKLSAHIPDVLNHNMETVPALYSHVRPGADYHWSLNLLYQFKRLHPSVDTKSGLMVGLGETKEQIIQVMKDLRANDVDMLTIGQYLQPSKHHLAVERYVTPEEFKEYEEIGYQLGFKNVASGPMVRSSYHADLQAKGL
ncbi:MULTISPECIES: lipoyl synthase [unclassified Neptuniibacter]|uniref:lipoyl synthase n=1 Tax=unclassified Neptuniibacter TaxID=2630693 RepID=UPI0025FEE20B|nr:MULTISPECIES: lipoyl synthase [unclassified Neptuniibacter]|tara:strand:+ start:3374 stop:4309 length:936 start_codon:yes stop_codon:yes gene_type:complete